MIKLKSWGLIYHMRQKKFFYFFIFFYGFFPTLIFLIKFLKLKNRGFFFFFFPNFWFSWEISIQAVPLFISEIAPAKYRGGLNICFQFLITVGILCANLINYGTSRLHPNGWRVSLGGAAVPALFLLIGSIVIVETPTSLIERGKKDKGLETLKKIRGVDNVDKEFEELLHATELAKQAKHSYRNLMKRSSRPQLICGTILQVFQQFTGINVIMFYAPVLFQTMGFGGDASLLSAVVTGLVNVLSTLVAIFTVDKIGRKKLLVQAAIQMLIAQVSKLNIESIKSMW